MKITNIITGLAGLALVAGCAQEYEVSYLDEIQLSETFISIPAEGGEARVRLTASVDWAFEKLFETDENVKDENGNTIYEDHEAVKVWSELPEWLTVNHLSGTSGEVELVFSADNNNGAGREENLIIIAGDKQQNLTVRQGEIAASEATVKDVFDGADGQTFIVTGTCTSIANTQYGNWYMKDDSTDEELYIYGTVDNTGNYNWDSFNIEVGDIVTVRGAKTTYGSTVELVDARFISVEKSLLQGLTSKLLEPAEGGEAIANFLVKGGSMTYEFPEELKSWVSIKEIRSVGDTTAVVFDVAEMSDHFAKRSGSITFSSAGSDGSSDYAVSIVQYPDAVETMQEVFDRINDEDPVTVEGVIAATCTNGFLLSKDDDLIFVYAGDFYETVKGKVGHTVRVSGSADSYNNGPQIGSVEFVEVIAEGTYEHGTPVNISNDAAIDNIAPGEDGLYDITYFTATGSLSDPYHNLSIEGARTQLAFYGNDSDDFDLRDFCDYCNQGDVKRNVTVTGYYISKQSTRINFIVTDIKEAE